MAKAKDKRIALEQWAEHFEGLEQWKNQFLIRLNGGLISGICLDETRDPNAYKPTFFFHNLLIPSPVLTLAYAAPFLAGNVYKPVKYGAAVNEVVQLFKEQVPALSCNYISMEIFVSHVSDAKKGRFGAQAIYMPNFLKDVITLGACFGDTYYRQTINEAMSVIATSPGINLNLIGSVEKWREDIDHLLGQDNRKTIASQIQKLKLPRLNDLGFSAEKIEGYWTLLG